MSKIALEKMELTCWGRMAARHLEQHQPKLLAKLKREGKVEEHLLQVQEETSSLYQSLLREGLQSPEARNQALRELIVLPDLGEYPEGQPDVEV